MKWYGDPTGDVRIKVPKSLPKFTEEEELDKLLDAMKNKKSHKGDIARDVLLVKGGYENRAKSLGDGQVKQLGGMFNILIS